MHQKHAINTNQKQLKLHDLQAAFCETLYHSTRDTTLESMIQVNQSDALNPRDRLWIHHNNMYRSLTDYLKSIFVGTTFITGDKAFSELCYAYIQQNPIKNPIIAKYGETFPDYITKQKGEDSIEAKLARFEWAQVHAFYSTFIPPTNLQVLTTLSPEKIMTATFKLQPSVTIIHSSFDLIKVWEEAVEGLMPQLLNKQGSEYNTLIYNHKNKTKYMQLTAAVRTFLTCLKAENPIDTAYLKALEIDGDFNLQETLTEVFKSDILHTMTVQ